MALTRTKNRVFIITPETRPSEFIKELLSDKSLYPNVLLNGSLTLNTSKKIKHRCPICGYPMQRRMNKNYGLELWMCMNDQEICGFMTNDTRGGDLSIKKCDWCKDGYLIVKPGSDGKEPILGCTNYKSDKDKSGCNRMMSRDYYLRWINDAIGVEDPSVGKYEYQRTEKVVRLPKMTDSDKPAVSRARTRSSVNTIITQVYYVGNEGFDVVCDINGNVLTDVGLLQALNAWRLTKAKEVNRSPYIVLSNATIVDLATRRPMTREELLGIIGVGEKKVAAFGDDLLRLIKSQS